MKNSVAIVALIALLIAFVDDVAASCGQIANEDMLEYFCEDGRPTDLIAIPENTEKLRITRMPIGRITADTFSRFGGNLWVLSCSHCEITDIDEDAFRRLVNLQQLSLNSNHLSTVKASWFEGLDYLTYLDLNYNNIRDIENDVYRNLPNLVDFRISGNRLRCLNLDEMSYLKDLKRIFLSENSDFACPHAVSRFLETQGVSFEPDPEWRRLASDTIDVPSSYAEEDHRTLRPNRKPEQPKVPYTPSKDGTFHPNYNVEHSRSRHKKPPTTTMRPTTSTQHNEIPRVIPTFPLTSGLSPSDSSLRQDLMMPHPHSTSETLPVPPVPTEWGPSEDIGMIGTTDHEPSQTNHASIQSSHVPKYETTPLSKDSVLDRLRVSAVGSTSSAEDDYETTDRSSQTGHTKQYPLYDTTSNDREGTPDGFIQVTHHSDSDVATVDSWSIDHSNQYPYWTNREYSRPPTVSYDRSPPSWSANTPNLPTTPYYAGYDPHKMIVDESFNTDDVPIVIDPVDQASQLETTTKMHYIRPSISSSPGIMYSPSGEFYPSTYYDSAVTMHPPLQNYRETAVNDDHTTTEQPSSACPDKNSANSSRIQSYIVALAMSIIVTVLGHVIAEGF